MVVETFVEFCQMMESAVGRRNLALGNSAKQMLPRTSMELKFQKQMLPASPRAQTMDLKFHASYQIGANLLVCSLHRTQNAVCCANHYKWSEQLKLCQPHFDDGKTSIVILIPKF